MPVEKEVSALTVVELRHELEKRGLEKSGLKTDLLKRLQKSIADDEKTEEKTKTDAGENKICDSSTGDKKVELAENGEGMSSVEGEKAGAEEEKCESDSKSSSVHSTESVVPDSEASEEKDNGEADSSTGLHESSKPDPRSGPSDSTSQEISADFKQKETDDANEQENVDMKENANEEENSIVGQEVGYDSKGDENDAVIPDANTEENGSTEDTHEESADSTSEMPENELTQEHADSTTSDQQEGDNAKDNAVESTSGNLDSLTEDLGEPQDLNELPEDERVEEPQQDNTESVDDSAGVILVPDEDPLKDEEMPEEDQIDTRCEPEDICNSEEEKMEVLTSVDDSINEGGVCIAEDRIEFKISEKELVEETKLDDKQADVVVIDDEDTDEVTIIEPEEEPNRDGVTPDDKIDSKHNSEEKGITETPDDKSESAIKVDATDKLNTSMSEPNDTSTTSKSKSKDYKVDSKTEQSKDDKKKDLARCLWISGLSSITKAIDLKERFSQHGKVVGAKVVTSAKTPGSQCFGFVTMSTAEEAIICIEKLHKSVLHSKNIQVEQAKTDPTPSKKPIGKSKSGERKDDEKSRSRHSSKSSASRARRDINRRPREDPKRSEAERKRNEKGKDKKAQSERGAKPSTPKDSASKDSSVGTKKIESINVKSRSTSKEQEKDGSKNRVEVVEVTNKAPVDSKDEKAEKVVANEKEEKARKSLEQLKRERAEKIEREHKLREERKKKERERERLLREDRRREQEKREKERKERARREAERVRREREKQRELEKQREREREKERERFIRERRERDEKERKEREKEREQLERERLERERLERERRERERLENEQIERERQERERLEKERIAREEHDIRIERERQRLEKERLERERSERDRRGTMVDRGLGNKRPLLPSDDRRGFFPEAKRSLNEPPPASRKGFFSPNRDERPPVSYTPDEAYDRAYNNRRDDVHKMDNRGKSDLIRDGGREPRRTSREDSRASSSRHDIRHESRGLGYDHHSTDIRRVVQRDGKVDTYSRERSPQRVLDSGRERSPHRGIDSGGPRYRNDPSSRNQSWIEAPNTSAPKTLSDVLGRAGLSGILGSRAEEKSDKNYSTRNPEMSVNRSGGDRFFSSGNHDNTRPEKADDRSYRTDSGANADYRLTRTENRDRRGEPRPDEHSNRAPRVDDRRGGPRYDDRRSDDRSIQTDNRGSVDYKQNRVESNRDERREARGDYRREPLPAPPNNNIDNDRDYVGSRPTSISVADRRGFPPLAADLNVMPAVLPPRVVPLTDVFGRPLQAVANPAHALQAGYAAAAQGLALPNLATGIQLNRNGRLEYTRMAPPNNVPSIRRF